MYLASEHLKTSPDDLSVFPAVSFDQTVCLIIQEDY